MNLKDYNKYLEKSGDTGLMYATYFEDNEHGWCSWDIDDDVLNVVQCYGDGKYWIEYLTKIGIENGCSKLQWHTKRNPLAFERKYKARLIGFIMEKPIGE